MWPRPAEPDLPPPLADDVASTLPGIDDGRKTTNEIPGLTRPACHDVRDRRLRRRCTTPSRGRFGGTARRRDAHRRGRGRPAHLTIAAAATVIWSAPVSDAGVVERDGAVTDLDLMSPLWHAVPEAEAGQRLAVDPSAGLSSSEAVRRRARRPKQACRGAARAAVEGVPAAVQGHADIILVIAAVVSLVVTREWETAVVASELAASRVRGHGHRDAHRDRSDRRPAARGRAGTADLLARAHELHPVGSGRRGCRRTGQRVVDAGRSTSTMPCRTSRGSGRLRSTSTVLQIAEIRQLQLSVRFVAHVTHAESGRERRQIPEQRLAVRRVLMSATTLPRVGNLVEVNLAGGPGVAGPPVKASWS